MAYTNSTAVKAIIAVGTSDDLSPFIETANALVTELCLPVTTYDTTRLELIERWLSAHFYAILKPRRDSEKAGPVSQKLRSKVDLNLSLTHYGQQAMLLDTAGGLSRLNNASKEGKRKTATIGWLGIADPNDYPET